MMLAGDGIEVADFACCALIPGSVDGRAQVAMGGLPRRGAKARTDGMSGPRARRNAQGRSAGNPGWICPEARLWRAMYHVVRQAVGVR